MISMITNLDNHITHLSTYSWDASPPGLSEMHGSPAAGRQPRQHCVIAMGNPSEIGIDMGHLEVFMGIWDKYHL